MAARGRALDALVTLVLLGGSEASILAGAGWSAAVLVQALLGGAAVIPLAWRRQAPVVVWAVSTAAATAITSGGSPGIAVLAPLIALYTVAVSGRRQVSAVAGVISLACFAATGLLSSRLALIAGGVSLRAGAPVFLGVVVLACWLIGDNIRVRRAYVAELQARAQRAEQDREADLARATARERTRIARELHDIITHHVSVIAVQAGAARMITETGGSATGPTPTWAGVEATARQALSELRELLGVLRQGDDPPVPTHHPGLGQLEPLLDEARRAGHPVLLRTEGNGYDLAPSADLCAYRVIQEALTNVRRHQGNAETWVTVRYQGRQLEIEVASPASPQRPRPQPVGQGSRSQPGGQGYGLAGMRERVSLLGGQLSARPEQGGGFLVRATIPVQGSPA